MVVPFPMIADVGQAFGIIVHVRFTFSPIFVTLPVLVQVETLYVFSWSY